MEKYEAVRFKVLAEYIRHKEELKEELKRKEE